MSVECCLPLLDRLWARGTAFLGSRYALLAGAMAWVSNHQLTSAISQAGGFGVLAGGGLSPQDLSREIDLTRMKTDQPFGVNLIVFHPSLDELIDVCCRAQVSHIFLSAGIPSRRCVQTILDHGAKPVGFAPSVAVGRGLIKLGVQALIIEGAEAGGHVGSVSTSVLAQEILPALGDKVPIFVAGGIGHGSAVAAYLMMGASGCQLGTRFACCDESPAHMDFKETFIRAHARDAVLSPQLDDRFPVIPVRSLRNQGVDDFIQTQQRVIESFYRGDLSQKDAQMEIEFFWAGALRRAVLEGDVQRGSLMAGQSVGLVREILPCQKIIDDLLQGALSALWRVHRSELQQRVG